MATTPSTKLENLLRRVQPCQFSSYKEFMRALMNEALGNTSFTFDQLNYDLYALNKELFNRLNRETTAFFKYWPTSNKPLFPMEPPLQHIGSSKVQGYKALMHDLIIEAILHHHVTFDTLKSYLSDFKVEIYHDLCEKAITYYDMFATKNIKSSGHWTC